MSEDSIKTAEEQLHALINESNLVLTKMKSESNLIFTKLRRVINILITVGVGIFLTFLLSFVDVRSRMATLEESKLSKVDAESKYSSKAGTVYLQNDIYDMNKMFFSYKPDFYEPKMELIYSNALKQFNGDITRSSK